MLTNIYEWFTDYCAILSASMSKAVSKKLRLSNPESETSWRYIKNMWRERDDDTNSFEYQGAVVYCSNFADCTSVAEQIWFHLQTTEEPIFILAIDTKYYLNASRPPDYTAVITICCDFDSCYVLHIARLQEIPKVFTDCLHHPKIRIVGYAVDLALRKLYMEHPNIDLDVILPHCIDVGDFANRLAPRKRKWSLSRLVKHFLNLQISDDYEIRVSHWETFPLSLEQQMRTVVDTTSSLLLYHQLKDIEEN